MTRINGRAVLILDRCDPTPEGHRVPYVSAMTLLGRSGGDVSDYTDVCDAISDETLGLESLAAECRLDARRRSQIVGEILASITGWEKVAREHGFHQSEIARFENTFTTGARVLGSFTGT